MAVSLVLAFYGRILIGRVLLFMVVLFLYALYEDTGKRRKNLRKQFCDFLLILLDGLQTGYSLENALLCCRKELTPLWGYDADVCFELASLERRVTTNQDASEFFREWGARSGISEIGFFAELLEVSRKTGGNMVQIVKNEVRVMRRKMDLQAEIQSVISDSLFQHRLMNYMPIGILFYMQMVGASFVDPLYHTDLGRGYMTIFLAIYGGTVLLGKILQKGDDQ